MLRKRQLGFNASRFERNAFRPTVVAYAGIALLILVFTVLIPALGIFHVPKLDTGQTATTPGRVIRITDDHLEETERGEVRHQTLVVDVQGSQTTIERTFELNDAGNFQLKPGEQVLLSKSDTPDGPSYYVVDLVRAVPIWALTMVFILMMLLVGRGRGIGSLAGMITSLLIIVRFVIPGILAGDSPLLLSISGSMVILLTTLYLAHGVNQKTTVALVGTAAGLLLTGVLAVVCTAFFKLSGLGSEDASTLTLLSGGRIPATGLLLGSIIIGGLGVLADMTIGQSSAVFEISATKKGLDVSELFRRGMSVGTDHVAAIVNTLVLAYAGASLPLLLILATQSEPIANLLNREFMSEEIVRTLVPCIGILAAVPITTALAALVCVREESL